MNALGSARAPEVREIDGADGARRSQRLERSSPTERTSSSTRASSFPSEPPPERRAESLIEMKAARCTAVTVVVPWNWHEVAPGEFDFAGAER